MKRLYPGFIMAVIIPFLVYASERWNVIDKQDGSMMISFNEDKAVISYEVVIAVNRKKIPRSIQIKFSDGHIKDGTSEELKHYWIDLKGINAVWKYLHAQNRVEVIKLHKTDTENIIDAIPYNWFGNIITCVTNRGKHFVGRLTGTLSSYGWFSIEIDGCDEPVRFHVSAVRELHKLK